MAKIPLEKLSKHLTPLQPVYLISGDEPLLVQEACDTIRQHARKRDFIDRELFHADANFQWHNLIQSANSLGLFAEKKLLEVRLSSSKISEQGKQALIEYCAAPHSDNLLLLVAPKLEKSSQNSKWFKAVDSAGITVAIWPINPKQLPRWIEQRLKMAGLRADSRAIDILASRVEGNLLAAVQEIEKLKLICHENIIDNQTMAGAVADSARYNVFGLLDKALAGHVQASAQTLNGLKGEGGEPVVILWAITRELRALIAIKEALSKGQRIEQVAKRHGIFDSRLPLIRGALQRLTMAQLHTLLKECAFADRCLKGMSKGDPWSVLLDLTLSLAGVQSFSPQAMQTLLGTHR